jgi:hypothetical protein
MQALDRKLTLRLRLVVGDHPGHLVEHGFAKKLRLDVSLREHLRDLSARFGFALARNLPAHLFTQLEEHKVILLLLFALYLCEVHERVVRDVVATFEDIAIA